VTIDENRDNVYSIDVKQAMMRSKPALHGQKSAACSRPIEKRQKTL